MTCWLQFSMELKIFDILFGYNISSLPLNTLAMQVSHPGTEESEMEQSALRYLLPRMRLAYTWRRLAEESALSSRYY